MDAGSPTPVLPAGLPEDWALDHDVTCPSCRYNLRMLRAPRCPECGLVFRWQTLLRVFCPRCDAELFTADCDECPRCRLHLDWARLLEANAQVDRKLFEYSDRPVRAALRTWVAVLDPWGFWRSIPLESPPAVERLRRLRRVALATGIIGLLLATTLGEAFLVFGWSAVVSLFSEGVTTALFLLFPFTFVLPLPLVTAVALPRFTPTLSCFRIRQDQIDRCMAYARSGLLWIGWLFILAFTIALTINALVPGSPAGWGTTSARVYVDPQFWTKLGGTTVLWGGPWYDPLNGAFNVAVWVIIALFGFLWWWVFLYVTLRRYLRLDRRNAVALFLSTQIIGLLVLAILSPSIWYMLAAWSLRVQGWLRIT